MEQLIVVILAVIAVFVISIAVAAMRRINRWNRTYERLSKRYGGKSRGAKSTLIYGFGFNRPSLTFHYGRTFCSLRNRKSLLFSTRRSTELSMIWPDKLFRLEVSTSPTRLRGWGAKLMQQVEMDSPQFQSDFYVSSNKPYVAQRLLTHSVQWQIEQLRRHMGNNEVQIVISRMSLVVSKPGYIKDHQELDDFVRFGLDLFDQLMLVNAEGIEFVNDDQASIVTDVKCPICSEDILLDMVVCTRCKTPHCRDCWQYNGQCATFACSETRFIESGIVSNS